MSVIYFTNNAATGDGSLYNAVQTARAGDVVSPDPTVFGVGERVVIDFVDILKITEHITLDAAGTKLILTKTKNTGNIPSYILIDKTYSTIMSFEARGIIFKGRVLIGDNMSQYKFYNCVFGGFPKSYHSVHTVGYCTVDMYDCALICGFSSAFYGTITKAKYTFTRCTFAANKTNEISSGRNYATYIDCIDEPDLATAEFANVPTSLDDVDVTKLDEYDFTPLTSSPYATGATTAAGGYDLNGNFRGRVTVDENGTEHTDYAIGAYEIIDADYRYAGEGDASNFLDAANWVDSEGNKPESLALESSSFYLPAGVYAFNEAPLDVDKLIIAGRASVSFKDEGYRSTSVIIGQNSELITDVVYDKLILSEGSTCSSGIKSAYTFELNPNASLSVTDSAEINALIMRKDSTLTFDGTDLTLVSPLAHYEEGTILQSVSDTSAYIATLQELTKGAPTYENVVPCSYGGGVTNQMRGYSNNGYAWFKWKQLNPDVPVCVEFRNNEEDKWILLKAKYQGESITITSGVGDSSSLRLYDGENFYTIFAVPVANYNELSVNVDIGYIKTITAIGYIT